MRTRPIGPGVGGLYYSPLLQDPHSATASAAPSSRPIRPTSGTRPRMPWQAIVGIARRAAQRLIDARLADAQRYVDDAARKYRLDAPAVPHAPTARYY